MEPRGSVPRIRKVAPMTVAAIFYAHLKEVTAYQKAEEIQTDQVHVRRILLR